MGVILCNFDGFASKKKKIEANPCINTHSMYAIWREFGPSPTDKKAIYAISAFSFKSFLLPFDSRLYIVFTCVICCSSVVRNSRNRRFSNRRLLCCCRQGSSSNGRQLSRDILFSHTEKIKQFVHRFPMQNVV